jgi:chromosome segregation ATPase
MSDNIKKKIESTEFYKIMLDILNQIKAKYENLDNTINELKKDVDRLHAKVENLDDIRIEVQQIKSKIEAGIESNRKEILKKLEGQTKATKEMMMKFLDNVEKEQQKKKEESPEVQEKNNQAK